MALLNNQMVYVLLGNAHWTGNGGSFWMEAVFQRSEKRLECNYIHVMSQHHILIYYYILLCQTSNINAGDLVKFRHSLMIWMQISHHISSLQSKARKNDMNI